MKRRKKILALIGMTILTAGFLAGCGKKEFGVAEVTTDDGVAVVAVGYRSTQLAVVNGCKLPNTEKATVHFSCSECNYDETLELVAPAAKIFKCGCKGMWKEASHFAIVVGDEKMPTAEDETE